MAKWEGPFKEKFDKLCEKEIKWEMTWEVDYVQSPEETLKKKGGDCEDFSILFASAARNIGISARVVEGKIQREKDKKPKGHVWVEIYYKRKWRPVDPTAFIEGRVSLRTFIDHPEKYPSVSIDRRYDEKTFEGKSKIQAFEEDVLRRKEGALKFLIDIFKNEKGREPNVEELEEIKQIRDYFVEKDYEIVKKGIPKDPRTLIQPDNPKVKAWVERIKSGGGKG